MYILYIIIHDGRYFYIILFQRKTLISTLVEQELFTLLRHTSSSPFFSGVHVAYSLFFWAVLYRPLCAFLSYLCWPSLSVLISNYIIRGAFFNSKSESCFRIRIPIPRFIINVKIMILNQANRRSSMIQFETEDYNIKKVNFNIYKRMHTENV